MERLSAISEKSSTVSQIVLIIDPFENGIACSISLLLSQMLESTHLEIVTFHFNLRKQNL